MLKGLAACDGNESCGLKGKLLDVASNVCGYTKDKSRHFETWWWNKDVDVIVCRKRELFRILEADSEYGRQEEIF